MLNIFWLFGLKKGENGKMTGKGDAGQERTIFTSAVAVRQQCQEHLFRQKATITISNHQLEASAGRPSDS